MQLNFIYLWFIVHVDKNGGVIGVMNWKGYGEKWLWPTVRFYPACMGRD
jgi:hypothetical protein